MPKCLSGSIGPHQSVPARAADELVLDQLLAHGRGAANVLVSRRSGRVRRLIRAVAEAGERDQIALLGIVCEFLSTNEGSIESHRQLDFTVPLFAEYLRENYPIDSLDDG